MSCSEGTKVLLRNLRSNVKRYANRIFCSDYPDDLNGIVQDGIIQEVSKLKVGQLLDLAQELDDDFLRRTLRLICYKVGGASEICDEIRANKVLPEIEKAYPLGSRVHEYNTDMNGTITGYELTHGIYKVLVESDDRETVVSANPNSLRRL